MMEWQGKKNVSNCSKISFLGYSISKEGISPDQALIEKILKVATLTNKKELESFLGYLLKYTDLTESFENLRKKNVEFIWLEEQQKSFL